MGKITELLGTRKKSVNEADTKKIIKELIDTGWSGSNEEQMKAVQLLKGLATSDDELANKFMKELDKFTSGMSSDKFEAKKKDEEDDEEEKEDEEDDDKKDDEEDDDEEEEDAK